MARKVVNEVAFEPRFKSSEGINPAFMEQRSVDQSIAAMYGDQKRGQWKWKKRTRVTVVREEVRQVVGTCNLLMIRTLSCILNDLENHCKS